MKLCNVYVVQFENKISDSRLNSLYKLLTPEQQERNSKYVRWQDRQANLYGKMLLIEASLSFGLNDEILKKVRVAKYGCPYYHDSIDFNISHAGSYVLCAIGSNMRVGVDIEPIRKIELIDFKTTMNDLQWSKIKYSNNPYETFFRYWTIKESIVKADGRGLSLELNKIDIFDNRVCYDGKTWYLKEIKINKDYSAHLACNYNDISINIVKTNLS